MDGDLQERHRDGRSSREILASVLGFLLLAALLLPLLWLRTSPEGSLWIDEIHSLRLAQLPVHHLLEESARDFHPPGYALALKGWLEAGRMLGLEPGVAWARSLNLVAWLLTLAACWFAGGTALGRRGGALLALCVGGSAAAGIAVRDLRGYVFVFAALAAAVVLLAALGSRRWRPGREAALWMAVALALAAALWSHLLAAPAVALLGLAWMVLAWRRREAGAGWRLLPGLVALAAPWVLFLPWLVRVPGQLGRLRDAAPDWMTPATVENLVRVFTGWIPLGRAAPPPGLAAALTVLGGLAVLLPLAAGFLAWRRTGGDRWAGASEDGTERDGAEDRVDAGGPPRAGSRNDSEHRNGSAPSTLAEHRADAGQPPQARPRSDAERRDGPGPRSGVGQRGDGGPEVGSGSESVRRDAASAPVGTAVESGAGGGSRCDDGERSGPSEAARAVGPADPAATLALLALPLALGSVGAYWLLARLGLAATFHGPRYPLLVAGVLAAGLVGAALAGARRPSRAALVMLPWLAAALAGQVLAVRQEALPGGLAAFRPAVEALAGPDGASLYVTPGELRPFVRRTFAGLDPRPVMELVCDPPERAVVLGVNPWPDLDRARDRVLRRALRPGRLAAAVERREWTDLQTRAVAWRLEGIDPELASRLCARGLEPPSNAPSESVAVAHPEDQVSEDGWSYPTLDADLDVRRWGNRPEVRIRFDRRVPAGEYRLHLLGVRHPHPSRISTLGLELEGGGLDAERAVGPGPFHLELPVTLERSRRPVLRVRHPAWSPARTTGSRDRRWLTFLFEEAWLVPEGGAAP